VADNPEVRKRLVQLQRQVAQGGSLVTEGRDQGTVAFPEADCKFFLTATPEERARRRWEDLCKAGEELELAQVIAAQKDRDWRDQQRAVGALVRADDALVIESDGKSLEEVVDELVRHVEKCRDK
jgi:cytidylate kinase